MDKMTDSEKWAEDFYKKFPESEGVDFDAMVGWIKSVIEGHSYCEDDGFISGKSLEDYAIEAKKSIDQIMRDYDPKKDPLGEIKAQYGDEIKLSEKE